MSKFTNVKLIGITGYKGSGKDTIAEYLVREKGFKTISFADKLRDVCSDVFNLDMDYFTDTQLKEQSLEQYPGWTPRGILIQIGTPGFRTICNDVWINYAMRTIDQHPNTKWVIPDIRFANEASHILDKNGKLLRVERDGCKLGNDLPETGLYKDYPDLLTIRNNEDKKSLYRMLDFLF